MSGKLKLKIWRPDRGETVEDAEDFEVTRLGWDDETLDKTELCYAAEKYADYCHARRDGWEWSWPVTFHVADEDGKFLGVAEVDRDMAPVFNAAWIPAPQEPA